MTYTLKDILVVMKDCHAFGLEENISMSRVYCWSITDLIASTYPLEEKIQKTFYN